MSDVYRDLGDIANHLLFEGFETSMEGTAGVPVLFTHLAQGTRIGIDLETVCLYLDQGPDEMPIEILSIPHSRMITRIEAAVKMLSLAEVTPDAKHLLNS